MKLYEIILIAIGLAMDAAAVSMTNGMCYRLRARQAVGMAASFGLFQGLMPLIGYFVGSLFLDRIAAFDHWIALLLLGLIGGKMVWDGVRGECASLSGRFTFGLLMLQSVATSVDALAVGVSFAAVQTNIWLSVGSILLVTFLLSLTAQRIGTRIGDKLGPKAEIFGGAILISIGVKIFMEHI